MPKGASGGVRIGVVKTKQWHFRRIGLTHILGIIPLFHKPQMIVVTQLKMRQMKPTFTDGIRVMFKPSFDRRDSFCDNKPHPNPISKLKLGPAKHAAMLISLKPLCANDPLVV
jgi:hypothetical protein